MCCSCPNACDARSLWLTCRAGQLRTALHLYQQAAGVKPEEEGKQEGTSCADTVAEASLKLAFLCNDLLQVGIAQPQSRVHDIDHIACNVMLDATGTVSSCKMMYMSAASCCRACFAACRTLLPKVSVAALRP